MPSRYRWDADALRFRDQRGRFISPEFVRSAVDAIASAAADDLEELARRLIDGSIDIAEFHAEARRLIRLGHVSAAAIAVGGRDRMGARENGRTGARLRQEYEFLYQFAREIERGEVSEAKLVSRIRMYASGIIGGYENMRRAMLISGYAEYRRRLGASAKHCVPCEGHAARGWIPTDTDDPLPAIGDECDCLSACHCRFEFRKRRATA